MRPHTVRRALLGALAVTACLAGTLLAATGSAEATHFVPAPIGSDDFVAARHYSGDFPDPSVVRVGSAYYAYATTVANKNLPVLRSTDLKSWTVAGAGRDADALPLAPTWSAYRTLGSRRVAPTWAPSVIRLGTGYLHAYATRIKDGSRFCISTSRSTSPTGPFRDTSRAPLVCPAREGAIDPYLWRNAGSLYLLFKTEGIPGQQPSRIFVRRLVADGSRFAPDSPPTELLRPEAGTWEGSVVENPAMFAYLGHYYLFYSANRWDTDRYAVGYAICAGPTGPCHRPGPTPLIASVGNIAGPGGESPFIDAHGYFRLAYHSWTKGLVGYPSTTSCLRSDSCPQRRMRVARLVAAPDHTLVVRSYVEP